LQVQQNLEFVKIRHTKCANEFSYGGQKLPLYNYTAILRQAINDSVLVSAGGFDQINAAKIKGVLD
jgi:hypothetical protein